MKVSITAINTKFMEWKHNHQGQRLGQYLMNQLIKDEACPEIFYEENPNKAYEAFFKKYANKS